MRKTKVSMDLPKVGDHLKRIMTAASDCIWGIFEPKDCVVTYVNESKHWYEVEFTDSHIRECYSLPVIDHALLDIRPGGIPVMCLETGMVYSSVAQCGRDMGIYPPNISKQLYGELGGCYDYHFMTIL